jgi:hypothetical protein
LTEARQIIENHSFLLHNGGRRWGFYNFTQAVSAQAPKRIENRFSIVFRKEITPGQKTVRSLIGFHAFFFPMPQFLTFLSKTAFPLQKSACFVHLNGKI